MDKHISPEVLTQAVASERYAERQGWHSVLATAKDILPWLIVACGLIYGYGVRNSTSDKATQQIIEDHIAIQEMSKNLNELGRQEAVLATKVDMLLSQSQSYQDRDRGTVRKQ